MRAGLFALLMTAVVCAGAQTVSSPADAFNAGMSFANTGKAAAAGMVNSGTGAANVPGYTTSAQQSTHYGNGKGLVGAAGVSKQIECQTNISSNAFQQQECDAVNFLSNNSTTRKKYEVSGSDSILVNSASVIDNAKNGSATNGSFTNCVDRVVTIASAVNSKEFCGQMLTPEDKECSVPQNVTVDKDGIFSCEASRTTITQEQCSSVIYSNYKTDSYLSPAKYNLTCGGDPTIQSWYNYYGGRCADSEGLSYWTAQVAANGGNYSAIFPHFYYGIMQGYPGGATKNEWLCYPGGQYIYPTPYCQYTQVVVTPTYQCTSLASQSSSGGSLTYEVLIPSTCGGDPIIQSWYQQYDSRCADSQGMSYWIDKLNKTFAGDYSKLFDSWYFGFLHNGGRGAAWASLCHTGDEYILNTTTCRRRVYSSGGSCQKQSSTCVDATPVKYFGGNAVSVSQVGGCWEYRDSYQCVRSVNDQTCSVIGSNASCKLLNTKCTQTAFNGDCMKESRTYRCDDPNSSFPGSVLKEVVGEVTSSSQDLSQCMFLANNSECTQVQDVCVESNTTKVIDGVSVYQECWKWQRQYTCFSGQPSDDCQNLALKGCKQIQGKCLETTPAGRCAFREMEYSCEVQPAVTETIQDCGARQFCMPDANGVQACFDTGHSPDGDFANAVVMMEAAREAGVYGVDPRKVEIFKGYKNECSVKVLGGSTIKSCCDSSSGGAAMGNNVLMSVAMKAGGAVVKKGSKYVYDSLFAADDAEIVAKGMDAVNLGTDLATEGGLFNFVDADFSVYGFDINFSFTNGFEVVGFDPLSFGLQIGLMLVMDWLACDQEDQVLSMKKGQNLCVYTGTRCSKRRLGICLERKQSHCCFNSVLAKIINVQGKAQLGRPIDGCGGFTADELQSLDFSAMDFSEFIASIQAVMPDVTGLRNAADAKIKERVQNYYSSH